MNRRERRAHVARRKRKPKKVWTAATLVRYHASLNDAQFSEALESITDEHEKDLLVRCPNKGCEALKGAECKHTDPGIVHFGRRIRRLLKGIR